MFNVCVLPRHICPVVEICYMLNVCVCVCVVPLYQHSSIYMLYVQCLCVLPRYLRTVVEICYMLNVCVFSR